MLGDDLPEDRRRSEVFPVALTPTPIDRVLCLALDLSGDWDIELRGFASPMHVTQEGPDVSSRYCPVQAFGSGGTANALLSRESQYERKPKTSGRHVVGGVDTHKDLHVAAVVDELDRVLASQCFATTRHGYKQMLAWMRSFGSLQRVGIEATGTYGAGLLRYLQNAGVEVLEVTTPDNTTAASGARTMISTRRMRPMRHLPAGQGHSILITSGSIICQDAAEVHGVAP